MLQGAIIGLVVGIVMVAVRFYKQGKGGQAIKEAIKEGGPAARGALDKYVAPSVNGKVSASKLLDHLERFGWLAILGDLHALEAEGQAIVGGLSVTTQLQAQALAGLLAHDDNPQRHFASMDAVGHRINNEGGAMLKLVKNTTNDIWAMARAMAGDGMDAAARTRLEKRAGQSTPAVRVVLLRLIARATEVAGEDPSAQRAVADEALARL